MDDAVLLEHLDDLKLLCLQRSSIKITQHHGTADIYRTPRFGVEITHYYQVLSLVFQPSGTLAVCRGNARTHKPIGGRVFEDLAVSAPLGVFPECILEFFSPVIKDPDLGIFDGLLATA